MLIGESKILTLAHRTDKLIFKKLNQISKMAKFIIEEFETYKATIHDGNYNNLDYSIELTLPDGEAHLRFREDDLPANKVTDHGEEKIYDVYYHSKRYMHVIDLLRNEGPLYFYYNLETGHSYITTEDEPVGEGELQR